MSIFVKRGTTNAIWWRVEFAEGFEPKDYEAVTVTRKNVSPERLEAELKGRGLKPVRITYAPCNFCNRIHEGMNTPCDMGLEDPKTPQLYGPIW